MTSVVSQDQLRDFLRKTTASDTIEELVEASRPASGPPSGLEAAGGGADPLSRSTLEKLARGVTLDSRERYHLEAIILPE